MGARGAPRLRAWARRGATAMAALAAASVGCARQSAPPGGPPDSRPPGVVATTPEAFADVPGFEGPVRFEFDERISEQVGGGSPDDAVIVSPSTGEVRVSHGRRSLSVQVDGGFRNGVVYRVTLQPVVRDMFGNTLRDPFELVFTTGAEAEATTVAGEVWDRLTGRGVSDLRLHAMGEDSLVHLASSGDGGIYAFRYLPGGAYTLTAFQDNDGDRVVDASEMQGTTDFAVASGDTLFVDVPVLEPDTTAALLLGAEALDSVTVLLRFDDFLDPADPAAELEISMSDTLGTGVGIATRYHETAYAQLVRSVADSLARVDSIARAAEPTVLDTLAAPGAADTVLIVDTLAVPGDPPVPDPVVAPADPDAPGPPAADTLPAEPTQAERRGPPPLPGPATPGLQEASARGRVLPGRRVVLVLDRPLEPGVPHDIVVGGVVNMNGVGGGGGEARVVLDPPQPPGPPGDGAP